MLQSFYRGFYIEEPAGNNAFSFAGRRQKRIYVPSLVEGSLDDVAAGSKVAFSEIVNGVEKNAPGLKHFVHIKEGRPEIFIFDNHNHAFFFWMYALKKGIIHPGETLIHVDQHKDTRAPAQDFSLRGEIDLKKAFEYTNFVLNVGSFIKPAVSAGIFADVKIIDSRAAFEEPLPDQFVLDLDLDIFSPQMRYIEDSYKIARIRGLVPKAKLVTIATSPFFMDQAEAIKFLYQIF